MRVASLPALSRALFPALLVLGPARAEAHLVASGMGHVYDGIAHFALGPEDVLAVAALGLFAGFRGPRQARAVCWVLPLAWSAGGGLGLGTVVLPPAALSLASAALLLLTGGLLACNRPVPLVASIGLGVVLGVLRGMADFAEVPGGAAAPLMLVGVCGAVFVVSALSASVTLSLQRLWMVVAARVCGSWIAALGVLLVGWVFRYPSLGR